jgi:hypothetical protein
MGWKILYIDINKVIWEKQREEKKRMRLGSVDGRNCLLAFGLDGCFLTAIAAVDVESSCANEDPFAG